MTGDDMTTRSIRLVAIILVGILGTYSLSGTSVRQVNLSEMVEFADRIFYGQCISAETKLDPDSGVIVQEYRFRVLESLKGVSESEVTIRQLSNLGRGGPAIPGMPTYQKGQALLLFLHGDSRLGLTSPVGMTQGTFRARKLSSGEVGFMNPQRNRNLTYELRAQSPAAEILSAEEVHQLDSGKPVPLSVFREMVEKLDRLHDRDGGVEK